MEKLFDGDEFCVLSHADLDGVVCVILLMNAFKNQLLDFKVSGYGEGKISANLKKLSKKSSKLVISDLSLSDELLDEVDKLFDDVVYLDHHETTDLSGRDYKSIINMNASGCLITLALCVEYGFKCSEPLKTMVKYANDYDLWNHKFFNSRLLNNAYWILGPFEFFDNFIYGIPPNFKKSELYKKTVNEEKKKKAHFETCDTYIVDNIRVVVTNDYISDAQLFYKENNLFIIKDDQGFSLRSEENLAPLYKLLEEEGIDCGGHKCAGGGTYDGEEEMMKAIEMFVNYLS